MKNNFKKIFPIIALILFCSIFIFLKNEIELNKSVYQNNEKEWQKEASRRSEIRALNNSFQKIQKDKDLLDTHFANSANVVPFLDALESMGKRINIESEVESVDISKEEKNFFVELTVAGSFEEISKYILLLENFPYELEIVSFNLNKDTSVKTKKEIKWEANIKLKLLSFIYKE